MTKETKAPQEEERKSVKEFFEVVPPGNLVAVKDLASEERGSYGVSYRFRLPALQLFCETEACEGIRFFEPTDRENLKLNARNEHFVTYCCRNCKRTTKTYALWSFLNEDGVNGKLFKFGEVPPFGPPTPARVISLIGSEKEYFLKGRRAENQGLGIAAFAYYRRVIENQKNKIFDEIIRVSEKIANEPALIDELKSAKNEVQFGKAVSEVKHGIPQALLINGHNPLTLLHSALSEGLHAQSDEQCLEIATSIRIVLTDFVEKVANTLKDEAELNDAVTRLLKHKSKQSKNGEQSVS